MSTDELTGVQALERKHPGLPLAPGKVERREFEYIRHGTRSRDGGQRREKLAMELAEECPAVVIPRVTALVVDPEVHTAPSGLASRWTGCAGAWTEETPGYHCWRARRPGHPRHGS